MINLKILKNNLKKNKSMTALEKLLKEYGEFQKG
jgi:hypothetical protein